MSLIRRSKNNQGPTSVDSLTLKLVMVCQAAGQTRFRALKHENGVAGSATVVVRVIACFQPLQICQEPGSGQVLPLADRLLRDAQCSEYCQFDLEMYGTGIVNPPACAGGMPVASELPPLGTSEGAPNIDTNLQYLHPFAKGLSSMSDAVLNRNLFARFSHMQKIPVAVYDQCKLSGLTLKQFLIFDQTRDKTTLIYSLGMDTSVHCPASSIPKPANCFHLNLNDVQMTGDANYDSDPILTTEDSRFSDSCGRNEYTDEIDALLSSEDEDNYSYNDEETSTGHSPSPMTGQSEKESCEEGMEEVASSPLPSKRLKVSHLQEACASQGMSVYLRFTAMPVVVYIT
ncbi:hypothetical protein AKJ16_DCAP21184, partial [Drosera capensis]